MTKMKDRTVEILKPTVLDEEWIQLIKEARYYGLTVAEIRHFLKKSQPLKTEKH